MARLPNAKGVAFSRMSRILNITRGYHMSSQRASRGVAECSFAWVDSTTVRNLTLAESVAKRALQTKEYDPLPYSEIPGLRFSGETDFALVAAAHKFLETNNFPAEAVA